MPISPTGRMTMAGADRRPRPNRPGLRRGFTLIELMVVLVIVGLALSLAALEYGTLPGQGDPRDIWATRLNDARNQAMRRGRVVALTPPQGGEAILFYPDGASSGGEIVLPEGRLVVDPVTALFSGR